jgi:hypothetical protein
LRVSGEVAMPGLALLLTGFGTGPLLWHLLSEVYGRKVAVLIPPYFFVAALFSLGRRRQMTSRR